MFSTGKVYKFTVARLGRVMSLDVSFENGKRALKSIEIIDGKKAKSAFVD